MLMFYPAYLISQCVLARKSDVETMENENFEELLWEVPTESGRMFPMLCEYSPKYSLKTMRAAWRLYVTKICGEIVFYVF